MELVNKTIGQCLRERAKKTGDVVALEMEQWKCSYQQLDLYVDHMVLYLKELGISHGTHVGIWGVNSVEWVVTFLALDRMGAIPILFNSLNTQKEMKNVLNYSDVEYLFYGKGNKNLDYAEIIGDIILEVPQIRYYIDLQEGQYPFLDLPLTKKERTVVGKLEKDTTATDIACMIFTSGTTSESKAVMLSHYNLVNNAASMAEAMRWQEGDKMCLTVPLFHCFGITASLIPCILCGVTVHLIASFRTAKIWEAIIKGCNILNGVPSMFMALISKNKYARIPADDIKSGIIAGSPVSQAEYEAICRRFYKMHLQPSYGQTEASPCISIADWNMSLEEKAVTVGKIAEHVTVRIMDPATGTILGKEAEGEIQVQGYNLMQGYYKRPEETKKAFTEDGWLRTGDIGRLDQHGNLSITGRLKEIIIRSGENIAPKEIETEIRRLKWIENVKVIGIPSPVTQEAVVACIIVKKGEQEDVKGMGIFLKERLAHYKVPEHVLLFEEFPLNASGKIHLTKLKTMAIDKIRRK